MHPSISTFPSKAFYDSKLLDGPEMESKAVQPWHQSGSLFPPYAFYHPVGAREERGAHHSLMNRTEASLAVSIYWRIANDYPHIDFAYRVGIITGYAAQVGEIRRQLRAKFPASTVAAIDVNTVDGFQGQEKDIIILSCVRGGRDDNNSGGGIGFLKDIRRMNVALTRAKSSMFIIGNRAVLSQDPTWKALVEDAAGRSVISEVNQAPIF
jgi:senataxin